jgi:hypothetical protein
MWTMTAVPPHAREGGRPLIRCSSSHAAFCSCEGKDCSHSTVPWHVVIPIGDKFRANRTLLCHTTNMRTIQGHVGQVERLDDHALLNLVERSLAILASRPLDETVDDAELAESVQRLHRLQTVTAAEKLRRIAEVDLRQTWRTEGARSTTDLLAQRLKLTRGQAAPKQKPQSVWSSCPKPPQQSAQARSGWVKPK